MCLIKINILLSLAGIFLKGHGIPITMRYVNTSTQQPIMFKQTPSLRTNGTQADVSLILLIGLTGQFNCRLLKKGFATNTELEVIIYQQVSAVLTFHMNQLYYVLPLTSVQH